MGRYVLVWVVSVLALLLATSILPGFRLDTDAPRWWGAVLRLPVVFALLLILLRPLLLFLTLPLNTLTLGFPSLLFNALILWLASQTERSLVVGNYGDAFLGTIVMTLVSTSIVGWLGLDEAYPFFQSVIYRVGRRFGPRVQRKPLRGLLILQVDGLSLTSLRRVLARGRMPTVSAMVAKGSHTLQSWRCGLPSNTPAVQAGFFYGSREHVAGYRWFDRAEQRVRVASHPEDLRELEATAEAACERPLLKGGSCINTFMSGGAAKRLMTVSSLKQSDPVVREGERADFNLIFLSPTTYTKAVLGGTWDFLAGLVLALAGRFHRDRPRLGFSLRRVAQRAVANAFLRDLSFFWIKQDMVRGVPVIYSNFVGYDAVAHHSDPDSYEAQISLAAFDRHLRKLQRRARRQSPITYDIALLSDHGQTPSLPFRIRYGETLERTVGRLAGEAGERRTDPQRAFNPDLSYTARLLDALEEAAPAGLGWAAAGSRRTLSAISRPAGIIHTEEVGERVVVCVSGCLAHIYFSGHEQPLHLEEICARFPGLVEGLARHPGIGFVAATREFGDAVAMGDDGIRNLITGVTGGSRDPLAPWGSREYWAEELALLLGGPDCGDLVVNGAWLATEQRIVVFEDQLSSHGGVGGCQTEPFLLAPSRWEISPGDLDSPEDLHLLLRRELDRYRPPEPASSTVSDAS